jgi:hypothetical protein
MIDSASSSYFWKYAVSADLAFFFFDPDRPGKTGEAVSILQDNWSAST